MKTRPLMLVLFLLPVPHFAFASDAGESRWATAAGQKGITRLQRRTYEDLAKLEDYEYRGLRSGISLAFAPHATNTLARLRNLGLDALPFLAEALDDQTQTKVITPRGTTLPNTTSEGYKSTTWKVNELVAMVIQQIARRTFELGEWGDNASLSDINAYPNRIPELQKLVVEWYEENRGRTPEERYLADLRSEVFGTRLAAEMMLGWHKSVKAVTPLMRRVERILGSRQDSATQSELAEVSLALGRIGNSAAYPAVRKACDHLSRTLPRAPWSGALRDLFRAYEGLALLGHKKAALAELEGIYEKEKARMEPLSRKEFNQRLAAAESW